MHHPTEPLWCPPRHHLEVPTRSNHVRWIELFYDLIHVVWIFVLGTLLSQHLNWQGVLLVAGLFTLGWSAWSETVFYTSLYISEDLTQHLLMAMQICAVMGCVAASPALLSGGAVYFAVFYALQRGLLALMYWRAYHFNALPSRQVAWRTGRNHALLALLFLLSCWAPLPWMFALWAVALAALQLGYILPKVGIMCDPLFTPRLAHLSERFALLMLIIIGEGFFKLVLSLIQIGIHDSHWQTLFNYSLGGLNLFLLCWVYHGLVGHAAINPHPRLQQRWWYGHLLMMFGVLLIAVALTGEVKIAFAEPYPLGYGTLGCAGLLLFIGAGWLIHSAIAPGPYHGVYGWPTMLLGIILTLCSWATVGRYPSILGNTFFTLAIVSQIAVPMWRLRCRLQSTADSQPT